MAYEMRGTFLEACDCYVMCPCWFDADPDENECTGTIAWYVEHGEVDGVDVSGLSTVTISYHGGHRRGGHWRVAVLVDERADDEQAKALADVFTGKRGGPLGELADLTGEVTAVQRVPITFTYSDKGTKLAAGQAVKVDMTPVVGATDRVTTVGDSALAVVLGPSADVGKSGRYVLDLHGEGFDMDVRGRSANRGRFSYVGKGRARRRPSVPSPGH